MKRFLQTSLDLEATSGTSFAKTLENNPPTRLSARARD
jgi:hypothetical protein